MSTSTFLRDELRERLDALLVAWSRSDMSALSSTLCDDVVFASPYTEPVDQEGLTRGRLNVLHRLSLERVNFFESLQIVDIMVCSESICVFLTCGEVKLSCLIEIDEELRFRRMIASMGHQRPH